eukprot:scaffold124581_cov20-Prasinocladus_malaysianus.AAC.1
MAMRHNMSPLKCLQQYAAHIKIIYQQCFAICPVTQKPIWKYALAVCPVNHDLCIQILLSWLFKRPARTDLHKQPTNEQPTYVQPDICRNNLIARVIYSVVYYECGCGPDSPASSN